MNVSSFYNRAVHRVIDAAIRMGNAQVNLSIPTADIHKDYNDSLGALNAYVAELEDIVDGLHSIRVGLSMIARDDHDALYALKERVRQFKRKTQNDSES